MGGWSCCWWVVGHVFSREDGHVLKKAFDLDVEGKWKEREAKKDMEEAG